jgi:hypothetical protein
MIEKVAIAQAFRKAFPNEMGGMPYTSEELPEEMTTIRDVTPAPAEEAVQTPPEATVTKPQDIQTEPSKAKATPEQTEKLKALAKNFTPEELAALKKDYGHDIDMLIDKMTEYSTPAQEQAQAHKWASPQVAEALKQSQPEQFDDDSKELYK